MGKPFRLQSLLEFRRQVEDEQARALGQVLAEEQRIREAIEALNLRREEQTTALAALMSGGTFDTEGYTQHAAYLDALGRTLDQHASALDAAMALVVERRAALVEALKDRRVLERLRDRQAEEAAVEDNRHEARDVDDLVMSRHQRGQ
ncbi:MAG: flagellar export protein FliJ [Dehalococcoidia bacterium]|nr:MAG: flagellar export protein FliJ [Dehalococcoidia bacterium]